MISADPRTGEGGEAGEEQGREGRSWWRRRRRRRTGSSEAAVSAGMGSNPGGGCYTAENQQRFLGQNGLGCEDGEEEDGNVIRHDE